MPSARLGGFLVDGRICLTNNAAERALRGVALEPEGMALRRLRPRRERAASMCSLIGTAKLNNVDPRAWLADILGRIAQTPASRLDDLLPWNWTGAATTANVA